MAVASVFFATMGTTSLFWSDAREDRRQSRRARQRADAGRDGHARKQETARSHLAAALADFSLSAPLLEVKKTPKGDVTVSGYASTFGPPPDEQGEIVDFGAYTATIEQHRQAGTSPIMLFSHDMDKVIGVWTRLSQDNHGLHVTGTILSSVRKGREAISLIEAKALNGLSVGFRCKKDARVAGVRHIVAASLVEISICGFPADSAATLTITAKEL
jgi:HK97 family phage prohead protease